MTKYNPFRPNNIVTPGMFRGRLDEMKGISQALLQTKFQNPHHFLIIGERGIGKSSLFLFVDLASRGEINLLENNDPFRFLTVSIELGSTTDYYDIIRAIGGSLKRSINQMNEVKKLASAAWDFLSRWEILGVKYNRIKANLEPQELLDNLTDTIESLISDASSEIDGILILIDEADKAPESARLGEFVKHLTERLTKRQCEKLVFGLAGLPSVIPKLRAGHESAPRMFGVFELGPLEETERISIIHSGLEDAESKNGFKTEMTSEAEIWIATLSEGYPHFIQEFAYWAFDQDTDNIIDATDVIDGAFRENGALDQLGHKYFRDLYFDKISTDEYRKVLNSMAIHSAEWVSKAEIRKSADVSDTTLTNALNTMKNRNIIIHNEGQRGQYRLPTRSFAAWINAKASVEKRATTNGK